MSELKVYKLEEAARILSIGLSTLRKLINAGKLKCSHYGRIVRISEIQILDFLKENEK